MEHKQARWYTKTNGRDIRLLVVHAMQAAEKGTTAEAVAGYFATTTNKVSAHKCFDNNSEVSCVYDKDIAYAAPGANHDGLHYEFAGYAQQTAAEWRDPFSDAMLARAAVQAYEDCKEYSIPVVWLSDAEIAAGKKGICDHAAISRVYKKSSHWDTGSNFPKSYFIDLVRAVPLLGQPAPVIQQKVVVMNNCVAVRVCPTDGGMQMLQGDGSVFNTPGCAHYHGSWWEPSMQAQRDQFPNSIFVEIVDAPNLGATHYRLVTRDGRFYEF